MTRQSTTAAAEYERLAKLAISPEDKALKSSLFAIAGYDVDVMVRSILK